ATGHVEIEHEHSRPVRLREPHGVVGVAGLRHDLHSVLGVEQQAQTAADDGSQSRLFTGFTIDKERQMPATIDTPSDEVALSEIHPPEFADWIPDGPDGPSGNGPSGDGDGRREWTLIAVGLVGLLALIALAFSIVSIATNGDDSTPATRPTTTAAPAPAAAADALAPTIDQAKG